MIKHFHLFVQSGLLPLPALQRLPQQVAQAREHGTAAISSTAVRNAVSLAFDGLLKSLTFLTNCNEAARISSSVTGGSKLKRVLMFLHITPFDQAAS